MLDGENTSAISHPKDIDVSGTDKEGRETSTRTTGSVGLVPIEHSVHLSSSRTLAPANRVDNKRETA